MEKLSRIFLFNNLKNKIAKIQELFNINDEQEIRFDTESIDHYFNIDHRFNNKVSDHILTKKNIDDFQLLLDYNLKALNKIESRFIEDYLEDRDNNSSFIEQLRSNLNDEKFIDHLFDFDITSDLEKQKDDAYKFNKLIRKLIQFNNEFIKRKKINLKAIAYYFLVNTKFYKLQNMVFLSYAYVDKLYTLPLFVYFLDHGIFLYVDWIFNNKMTNGINIKKSLVKILGLSNQLLFLRSINSELSIRGGNIRGWCAWELGSFYVHNKNEKYYISVYDHTTKNHHNTQLDGIKPLQNISNGRLS